MPATVCQAPAPHTFDLTGSTACCVVLQVVLAATGQLHKELHPHRRSKTSLSCCLWSLPVVTSCLEALLNVEATAATAAGGWIVPKQTDIYKRVKLGGTCGLIIAGLVQDAQSVQDAHLVHK